MTRGTVPNPIKREVRTRASGRCEECGATHGSAAWDRPSLEIHHKTTRKQDGPHTPDNLILICYDCHRAKHQRRFPIQAAVYLTEEEKGALRNLADDAGETISNYLRGIIIPVIRRSFLEAAKREKAG